MRNYVDVFVVIAVVEIRHPLTSVEELALSLRIRIDVLSTHAAGIYIGADSVRLTVRQCNV